MGMVTLFESCVAGFGEIISALFCVVYDSFIVFTHLFLFSHRGLEPIPAHTEQKAGKHPGQGASPSQTNTQSNSHSHSCPYTIYTLQSIQHACWWTVEGNALRTCQVHSRRAEDQTRHDLSANQWATVLPVYHLRLKKKRWHFWNSEYGSMFWYVSFCA